VLVAAACTALSATPAEASYCGLGGMMRGVRSGRCCPCPVAPCYQEKCYTVWKDVPQVCYQNVCETLYRTVWETTYHRQPVTRYRHVSKQVCQNVPYTYNVPHYETYSQTYTRPYYRPVYETQSRVVSYTTFHTVYESFTQVVPYTVYRPVYETHTAVHNYTTYRPQYDTVSQPVAYTVYRTVHDTVMRPVPYTVCRKVPYTETIPIHSGCWQTYTEEVPGPVVTKCIQEPGCWEWDPCCCRCVYKPGPCRKVQVQCPPRKVCRRVWVPRVDYKEVTRCRLEYETHYKNVPYTVCRSVPEVRTSVQHYTVCRMIPEVHSRPYNYTVTRVIPETHTRVVPYTVARAVPQVHSKTIYYQVCRPVVEYQTYTVPYTVCRMIPKTAVRKVSYTTWQTIPYTTTVCVPQTTPKQVPYTVSRCVPKVTYKKVCVRICCPITSCGCTPPAGAMDSAPSYDAAPAPGFESDPGYDPAPPPVPEGPTAMHGMHYFGAAAPLSPQPEEEKPEPVMIVTMQKKAGAEAASDLFLSGLKLYHDGAFDAAAKEFGAAAELAPTKAKYLYFQALATYQKGDFTAAGDLVAKAAAVEQANPGESWGRMMERIQGPHRLWLEDARRQSREAAAVQTAEAP
jgi:hypothetical protein